MAKPTAIDFKGLTDWVEVFRAGTHRDSLGRTHTFSRAQLDEIVTNLQAGTPPPHVITHKELYSPFRYGDVVEARRDGDSLYVKSANIEPQFARLVEDGRLRDRSVRLARNDKGLTLSHVAWLGAEPPAVEGMAPVQFAAALDQVMDFSWEEARSAGLLARAMRRLREFLIDKYSVEDADRVMPSYEVESADALYTQALSEESTDSPTFSAPAPAADGEDMSAAETERLKAELEAANAQNAEFARANAALQREKRVATFTALAAAAIAAGRLTPAQAEGMAEFAANLADADGDAFEFSAGDGTAKKSPAAWFSDFIAKLGQQQALGETDAGAKLERAPADFAAPGGHSVDDERLALHRKAVEHRKANPTLSYEQAVAAVQA